MVDFIQNRLAEPLTEDELKAINILRSYGWRAVLSPYVDDFSEHDLDLFSGRMSIAVCKRSRK